MATHEKEQNQLVPATNRFRLTQRLITGAQFDRVFKKNFRSRNQHFIVLASRNHLRYARLGLAVSRKAAGDSVPRNKLKRLIRETFRCHEIAQLPFDLVVMAKQGAARFGNEHLINSLNQHWTRITQQCEQSSKN